MIAGVMMIAALAGGAGTDQGDGPWVMHVGLVTPETVGVRIRAGRSEYGRQVPYEKRRGDVVDRKSHHRWVRRTGKFIGALVGADETILDTPDRLVGRKLDAAWADRPGSYRLTSPDDPNYAKGARPEAVHRKSKPADLLRVDSWRFASPVEHVIYLKMPRPLAAGKKYTLSFDGGGLAAQTFVFDPAKLRSEAVHVSHLGFRPDDPAKVAFLSCWLGSGGGVDYAAIAKTFRVVDAATGKTALAGRITLAKAAADTTEDAYKRNYSGVDVYQMDFSALKAPGTYRVCVDGVGCSYPFAVGPDVWRKAFIVSACGFYHQRSGIALGPPHTDFKRPRCFHPADGVKVYASTAALMDTGNGLNRKDSNFGNLVKGATDRIVPDAWGAYMDAGDWDRRIQHLVASRYLLELARMQPGYFAEVSLNIPESSDGLPDIVSEALFNLDGYRRMQTAGGGIRGGIESAEHPRQGEGSWQESLTVYAYAPGVWSSYEYAGVAARAAGVLAGLKPKLAAVYRDSAARAFAWAEKELPKRTGRKDPHAVSDSRNLAAAELFRLTGEKAYHDVFAATTALTDPKAELFVWKHHNQSDAAWVYVRADRPGMDARLKANCRGALLRRADERAACTGRTGFRWAKYAWQPPGWGSFAAPDAVDICRAHALTGDAAYLRAAVLACQTGAGANPVNLCYTTGLGHRWPANPLHVDARIMGTAAPPGLTVFGPRDPAEERKRNHWALKLVAPHCHPPPEKWPVLEAYWDVFWYPSVCEYTIQNPMARNAYAWGYLAARK